MRETYRGRRGKRQQLQALWAVYRSDCNRAMRSHSGSRKGKHGVKSVPEKTALAAFSIRKPRGRGLGEASSGSLWKQAGLYTTKGSFLPVRPRYRREVEGQRLSAKADDKVCCFSPVRRSMTYQMSCFLPETSQGHTVVYTRPT